jgi:hypothetical protein
LPGDAESTVITIPVLGEADKPSFFLQDRPGGPLGELSLKRLIEVDAKHDLGFTPISNLLAKDRKRLSGMEKRLLSSVQWSGRATIDVRKEEAFLLYAIALESIVLAEVDKDELIYRLRTRIAHLLGSTLKERLNISKEVGRLYGIRSSIVPNGTYEVLDQDVSLMRNIAKIV